MEGLLLGIGFIGLILALLTPNTKLGAALTLASFAGYFTLVGVNAWLPIILFVLGLLLLIMEVFIPDFGLIGILGVLLIVGGLYMTIGDLGQTIRDLSLAVLINAVLVFYLLKRGYTFNNLERLVLKTDLNQNDVPREDRMSEKPRFKTGMEGIATTTLRPSGKAEFGEEAKHEMDVLSAGGHIEKGARIVIDQIQGTKIVVRRVDIDGR